ncbi:MAG: hypothetical protein EXX96DRAFT_458477, partial [Benjaminiella poitrasii]
SAIKRTMSDDDMVTDESSFKRSRSSKQPRWYNQAYMLFLALRQHPDRALPRGELIRAALALDEKISAELHLPKVFRSKTPGNSASACLTLNNDRYFIAFKPEGSRSTHFKLAYEPGDETKAIQEYQKWCTKLAEHDWPYCFGIPRVTKTMPSNDLATDSDYPTPVHDDPLETSKTIDNPDANSQESALVTIDTRTVMPETEMKVVSVDDSLKTLAMNVPSKLDSNNKRKIEEAPSYTLDELDLSDIPRCWRDIVYVAPSKIPGAGNGLFAKRKLPYNTPIGFYFGVPMTEDEFDSLKDRVGRASEYSIMYRRTVLDATDNAGEPVTDEKSERFCPFHFMNETDQQHATIAFVEGIVVNQVICWTRKDIEAGEELLVWYGADVDRHWAQRQKEKQEKARQKERQEKMSQEEKRA